MYHGFCVGRRSDDPENLFVEVAAFDATTAPSVDIEDPESHLTHARREVAVGAGLGLAAIALAPLPVLFAQLMANAVYSPTFSLLGLHLLWAAAAFLAVGQGVRMWRMARWAGAHEDEELLERTAQLTLWVGAALLPLLALVALLTAVLL